MSVMPFSGEQWTIRHGEHEVTVVEVGGGIRSYTYGGRDVVSGYPAEAQCTAGRGQLLMPWPNRIRDGRFTFEGRSFQLALTEPSRGNASHGLVRWSLWQLLDRTEHRLTVSTRLLPQQGWAWFLDLEVTYQLDDTGLTVTPRALNIGPTDAPFGFGAHPYLTLGEALVDELEVQVPGRTRLLVDDERLLPLGLDTVEGSEADLLRAQPLGLRRLDTAYTDLAADPDGRWRVRLSHPGTGRAVQLWAQADAYPWLQVFTGDSLPPDQARRTGIAVEPMTCPPDAFNSRQDLLVLRAGQSFSAPWGIAPS